MAEEINVLCRGNAYVADEIKGASFDAGRILREEESVCYVLDQYEWKRRLAATGYLAISRGEPISNTGMRQLVSLSDDNSGPNNHDGQSALPMLFHQMVLGVDLRSSVPIPQVRLWIRSSGLIDEILALKIWRRRHALRFPSFLMELATIHARPRDFRALLHFLATDFPTTRLLDPANSSNVVSDLLTDVEKLRIAARARASLTIGGRAYPARP